MAQPPSFPPFVRTEARGGGDFLKTTKYNWLFYLMKLLHIPARLSTYIYLFLLGRLSSLDHQCNAQEGQLRWGKQMSNIYNKVTTYSTHWSLLGYRLKLFFFCVQGYMVFLIPKNLMDPLFFFFFRKTSCLSGNLAPARPPDFQRRTCPLSEFQEGSTLMDESRTAPTDRISANDLHNLLRNDIHHVKSLVVYVCGGKKR